MRFSVFCSYATNTRIFENPFSIQDCDAHEELQLELQYDSILHSSFNKVNLITLYMLLYYNFSIWQVRITDVYVLVHDANWHFRNETKC
jgi:hypothetical protein